VNIHHLELFYYVARHGGISEAVRKIPYGIQQPAVSAQILQLERTLGTKLFQRRPFELTPPGARLYAFIEPFFGRIGQIAGELMGHAARFIRLGASGPVLRTHVPAALRELRAAVPGLTLSLTEAYAPQLVTLLKKGELDLAVTVMADGAAAGLSGVPLVELPLALLVPKSSKLRTAAELWERDTVDEPLISAPAQEPISAHFQRGLHALGVDWTPTHLVGSLELVETYVAEGFGMGVTVMVPGVVVPPTVRRLPLPGFEPLMVGVIWPGEASPLIRQIAESFQRYVANLPVDKEAQAAGARVK
jgi:DNA-binding transcriptional LysR family regulator